MRGSLPIVLWPGGPRASSSYESQSDRASPTLPFVNKHVDEVTSRSPRNQQSRRRLTVPLTSGAHQSGRSVRPQPTASASERHFMGAGCAVHPMSLDRLNGVTNRNSEARTVDWRAELRARGHRLTPQRELVLEAVDELEHATPEQILGYVRKRSAGVNISTIYRTLDLLEEYGLVNHTHLGHGAPTYHSTAVPQHVHLKCRSCKRIIEVAPATVDPLVQALRTEHGFETDVQHLTVFGACKDCTDR